MIVYSMMRHDFIWFCSGLFDCWGRDILIHAASAELNGQVRHERQVREDSHRREQLIGQQFENIMTEQTPKNWTEEKIKDKRTGC